MRTKKDIIDWLKVHHVLNRFFKNGGLTYQRFMLLDIHWDERCIDAAMTWSLTPEGQAFGEDIYISYRRWWRESL